MKKDERLEKIVRDLVKTYKITYSNINKHYEDDKFVFKVEKVLEKYKDELDNYEKNKSKYMDYLVNRLILYIAGTM